MSNTQTECIFDFDSLIYVAVSLLSIIVGLFLGLRFRKVICHKLQPIVNNIHHHYLNIIKEEVASESAKEEVETPKEE